MLSMNALEQRRECVLEALEKKNVLKAFKKEMVLVALAKRISPIFNKKKINLKE